MLHGTIAPTGVLVKVDGNFPVRFFVKWQMHPFKGCMLEFNLSLRGVIARTLVWISLGKSRESVQAGFEKP
jgi:hypothetical protein